MLRRKVDLIIGGVARFWKSGNAIVTIVGLCHRLSTGTFPSYFPIGRNVQFYEKRKQWGREKEKSHSFCW